MRRHLLLWPFGVLLTLRPRLTQRPAASQVWGRQKRVWVPLLQEPRQGLKVPQTSSPQLVPSATGVKRQPVLGSQESVVQRLPSVQRVGRPP